MSLKVSILIISQFLFIFKVLLAQLYPLDSTFGVNGHTIADITSNKDFVQNHIAMQSDGKIVIATSSLTYFNGTEYNYDFCIIRYNTDGTIDNSFGEAGIVITDLGSPNDIPLDIVTDFYDRIVVAGTSTIPGSWNSIVVRYNPDGSLDSDFGNNGIVTENLSIMDIFYSIELQPDGKILAGGIGNFKGSLYRFLTDGSLDSSFGDSGKTSLQFGEVTGIRDIAYTDDGYIIVAGNIGGAINDGFVAKLNPDGSLNISFASNGKYIVNYGSNEFINAVGCQSDGKIILAGTIGYESPSIPMFGDFLLTRLLPNGIPDLTFNNSGVVTIKFGVGYSINECCSVSINANNDIFAVGYTDNLQLTNSRIALAKLTANGSLDFTYGSNGKVISEFGSSKEKGMGSLLDYNDKLVVSGIYGANINPILARYETVLINSAIIHSAAKPGIMLFHNPDDLTIHGKLTGLTDGKYEYKIHRVSGDIFSEGCISLQNGTFSIEVKSYLSGIYILSVFGPHEVLSKSFIRI